MNVEITARHFSAPDNVREYALNKINRIYKYFDRPISCQIILTLENNEHSTDINLSVSGKKLFASETSDDIFKSIDGAVDKLIGRVLKFKNTRYIHK